MTRPVGRSVSIGAAFAAVERHIRELKGLRSDAEVQLFLLDSWRRAGEDFHMALMCEMLSGPGDCAIDQYVQS
ncbi:ephrin-A3-like protein [Lates japonicus]|uniref:Ephrin-A3-like protein n=1 Tax=Lates japonicus TaxID=270547 RepID=A0AAD3R6L9_LATJO|nr:ephrin-A3-like protein [Lates japonicus]